MSGRQFAPGAFSGAYSRTAWGPPVRQPKPWYRSEKDCWYARVNGRKVSLGVRGRANHAEAFRAWLRALSEPASQRVVGEGRATPVTTTLREAADAFLADAGGRLRPNTMNWYRRAVGGLAAGVPDAHVAELLGHTGTAILHRHYAHLTGKARVMRAALGQVRGCG
jgi:hypothetical protein